MSVINPDQLKRIHSGKKGVDARVDLHGLSQDEAYRRVITFIRNSHNQGLRVLLAITGKGKDGTGILRKNLKSWLMASADTRAVISGISPAQPKHGGDGAFYITLKKR